MLKSPFFWLVLLLACLYLMVSNMMKGAKEIADSSQTSSSSKNEELEITEEYKSSLATTFCDERSKPYTRSVNLEDFILMYDRAGETVDLHPETGVPSEENCKKVIDICLAVWDKKDCEGIAEKNIWIGMDKDQVILSWGLPDDTNNTITATGVRAQWVYDDLGPYVYLEGKSKTDLIVTSWQD